MRRNGKKYLEKENIFLVEEKKNEEGKGKGGNHNRRQPGEYSAICLFEGLKIEGRDLQYYLSHLSSPGMPFAMSLLFHYTINVYNYTCVYVFMWFAM